jgi:hypothetical protein
MDKTRLIDDEVLRVQEYLANPKSRLQANEREIRDYVEHVFDVHAAWISRWQYWSVNAPAWAVPPITGKQVRQWYSTFGSPIRPNYDHEVYKQKYWPYATAEVPFACDLHSGKPVSIKIRRGQSVARVILGYASDNRHFFSWSELFSRLGEWWDVKDVRVQFSCAPSDFMSLGHFHAGTKNDSGSCFSAGGECEDHKMYLSVVEGSCVVMLYKDFDLLGRMWGLLTEHGVILTNAYMFRWSHFADPLREAAKSVIGAPKLVYRRSDTADPLGSLDTFVNVNDNIDGAAYLAIPGQEADLVLQAWKQVVKCPLYQGHYGKVPMLTSLL